MLNRTTSDASEQCACFEQCNVLSSQNKQICTWGKNFIFLAFFIRIVFSESCPQNEAFLNSNQCVHADFICHSNTIHIKHAHCNKDGFLETDKMKLINFNLRTF